MLSLETSLEKGLSHQEATQRLLRDGPNELKHKPAFHLGRLFMRQCVSPLAVVLILAGLATLFLGEWVDAVVIAIALLINIALGMYQEGRASRVFDELTKALEHNATVMRDGEQRVVPRAELCVGDIVILEAGKTIPADVRLVEAFNLKINEAAFTGEWLPVKKHTDTDSVKEPREASNLGWGGTIVADGSGKGVVVAVGEDSAFGKLAIAVQVDNTETPLMKSVHRLARAMITIISCILIGIIIVGLIRGEEFTHMLLLAIAVAVAAMPEGLPAAITIVLSIAMEAILKKGGLVKSLIAAETLGSTTVILTDKTGTLTEGNMSVAHVYSFRGATLPNEDFAFADNAAVIRGAVLASDAFVDEEDGEEVVRGRPVEQAVIRAGLEIGCTQKEMHGNGFERINFLPFSSARRYAGSLNKEASGELRVYLSGAPEKMLQVAKKIFVAGATRDMDTATRELFTQIQNEGSKEGKRFIGVAYTVVKESEFSQDLQEGNPKELVFLGLMALADVVRKDVPAEIARAREAQVRVIMVTGDYPETARAVAQEAGIAGPGARVLTGQEMEEMTDAELYTHLKEVHILARVLPETKLRIARVLRAHNEVVAMTGDGVNDAPALMAADIGVAVGSGTDVAKSASDVILLNNTFSTITASIAEGRRAVDNLRKAVLYLLSTSMGEVVIIAGAIIAGMPLPLLPTQLLWTNIIHEGFMSVPYAFEPGEKNLMARKPHGIHEAILTPHLRTLIGIISLTGGAVLFGLYLVLELKGFQIEHMRTIMFGALSLTALSFALSLKDIHRPLWRIPIFNNKALLAGLCGSLFVLFLSFALPPLRELLSLNPISLADIEILAVFALVNIILIESAKMLARYYTTPHRLA